MFDFEKNVLGAREHHKELMREAEAHRLARRTSAAAARTVSAGCKRNFKT